MWSQGPYLLCRLVLSVLSVGLCGNLGTWSAFESFETFQLFIVLHFLYLIKQGGKKPQLPPPMDLHLCLSDPFSHPPVLNRILSKTFQTGGRPFFERTQSFFSFQSIPLSQDHILNFSSSLKQSIKVSMLLGKQHGNSSDIDVRQTKICHSALLLNSCEILGMAFLCLLSFKRRIIHNAYHIKASSTLDPMYNIQSVIFFFHTGRRSSFLLVFQPYKGRAGVSNYPRIRFITTLQGRNF